MVEVRFTDVPAVAWLLAGALARHRTGRSISVRAVLAAPFLGLLVLGASAAYHRARELAVLVFRRGRGRFQPFGRVVVRPFLVVLGLAVLLDVVVSLALWAAFAAVGLTDPGLLATLLLDVAPGLVPALLLLSLVVSATATFLANPQTTARPPREARWIVGPAAGGDGVTCAAAVVEVVGRVVPAGETAFALPVDDAACDLLAAHGFVGDGPRTGMALTVQRG